MATSGTRIENVMLNAGCIFLIRITIASAFCLMVGVLPCAQAIADDIESPTNNAGPGLIDDNDAPARLRPAPGEPTAPAGTSTTNDGLPPLVIPPAYPHRPQSPAPAEPGSSVPMSNELDSAIPDSTTRMRPVETPLSTLPSVAATWEADPRFGLIVLVRESFANQFVQRNAQDSGPVRDCILGARVVGDQMTFAATQLDFLPDVDSARMVIRLTGTVHNNTVGITPQAQVFSRGEHDFRLEKEVDFDGLQFLTRSPSAWVTPRICNTGATTPLRDFPLIGEPLLEPVARMTALSAAEQQRRQAELIAAQRVTAPAAREFNEQSDRQLTVLNQFLQQLQQGRSELGIAPEEERVHSTADLVQYSSRYPDTVPQTPIPQDYREKEITGMELLVNDSLLNAAANDLPLAGVEFNVREVEEFIEGFLVNIPGFVPNEPPANPLIDQDLLTVRLDATDPIDIAFLENETHLSLRMSFIPSEGPIVPTKVVTIVYRASITDEWVILTPADVRVTAAPGVSDPIGALTEGFIRQQFTDRLIPLQFRNGSTITLPDAPSVRVTVTELSSHDGWLMLSAE